VVIKQLFFNKKRSLSFHLFHYCEGKTFVQLNSFIEFCLQKKLIWKFFWKMRAKSKLKDDCIIKETQKISWLEKKSLAKVHNENLMPVFRKTRVDSKNLIFFAQHPNFSVSSIFVALKFKYIKCKLDFLFAFFYLNEWLIQFPPTNWISIELNNGIFWLFTHKYPPLISSYREIINSKQFCTHN